MFRIDVLEWVKVIQKGKVPLPVYAHNSCVYGSEFIVFGGMNGVKLSDHTMNICELHVVRSKELADLEEERKVKSNLLNQNDMDTIRMIKFENSFNSKTLSSSKNIFKKGKGKSTKFIPGIDEEDEETKMRRRIIMEHVEKLENDEFSYLEDP